MEDKKAYPYPSENNWNDIADRNINFYRCLSSLLASVCQASYGMVSFFSGEAIARPERGRIQRISRFEAADSAVASISSFDLKRGFAKSAAHCFHMYGMSYVPTYYSIPKPIHAN